MPPYSPKMHQHTLYNYNTHSCSSHLFFTFAKIAAVNKRKQRRPASAKPRLLRSGPRLTAASLRPVALLFTDANNLGFHNGLQMVYDSHCKSVALHGCTKHKQIKIEQIDVQKKQEYTIKKS